MEQKLIIKNAMVVDGTEGNPIESRDLFIENGLIVESLDETKAQVIDAAGIYAAPGFIDMHVHVFEGYTALGIQADRVGVSQGVIQVVDAGSTGIEDYPVFKREVIEKNQTGVLFFLNISRKGLCKNLSELENMDDLMTGEELARILKDEPRIVGLKVRMSSSVVKGNDVEPLKYARKLADKAGIPIMVHIGNAPPKLGPVLDLLKKGDIVTHCFHGKAGNIVDYPQEFKAAADRGVHFDIGHGNASFSYETVHKVLSIKDVDYSISTDIYNANYEKPVGSLMDTMSKLMPLGVSLEKLVNKVTLLPRKILKLPQIQLLPGDPADITLFKLNKGAKRLVDSEGYQIEVSPYLEPVAAIKNGREEWEQYG